MIIVLFLKGNFLYIYLKTVMLMIFSLVAVKGANLKQLCCLPTNFAIFILTKNMTSQSVNNK